MAIELGSQDLVEYDTQYGILICRQCQYAIQKSAVNSHLLRHHIYRGERQAILSSIMKLNLAEPNGVRLPEAGSSPIKALSVIEGYRCLATGCDHLCASVKRMRTHCSEFHGSDRATPLDLLARPANLQTFFRGTKVNYFEVAVTEQLADTCTGPRTRASSPNEASADSNCGSRSHKRVRRNHRTVRPPADKSSSVELNLDHLACFHHFTNITSLTLPIPGHAELARSYWQTSVVMLALHESWLMYGLLALSAYHSIAIASDSMKNLAHEERLVRFHLNFSTEWNKKSTSDDGSEKDQNMSEAGEKIRCILQLANWASTESKSGNPRVSEAAVAVELHAFLKTLEPLAVREETRSILLGRSGWTQATQGDSSDQISKRLDHLHALPYRMADSLGRPESVQDVLAALAANSSLIDWYERSYASDEMELAWRCMTSWLAALPNHFKRMIERNNPAALVVVAHWAAFLVERVEHCGCWFLKGLASALVLQISQSLSSASRATYALVKELLE